MFAMTFQYIFLFGTAGFWLSVDGTSVKFTGYWVAFENDFKPLGTEANLATCSGQSLARTGKKFADTIALEGSGYLRDDKTVLNLGSCVNERSPCKPQSGNIYKCFDKVKTPVGSRNNPLMPFTTIASNDIPFGSTGIIREFQGKRTPKGEVHDGCVKIEDSCSTCSRSHIDFFAYKESYFYKIKNDWGIGNNVDFEKKSCTPKRYTV